MQDAELTKEPFGQKIISALHRHLPLWCFFAILLISLIPAVFEVIPQRDVALRYAPMADAFRDGDFLFAFHPRTSFLHTTFAGIIAWIFRCDGFTACKVSSLLFLAAGVFPLFALARTSFSRTMAEITLLVYVFCSPLLKLGSSGLRDTHKCFLILLGTYALLQILQNRKQWKGYLCLGIAAGLGVITRGDLIVFMLLLLFWGMVLEWKDGFPRKSLNAVFIAIFFSLPAVIANYILASAAMPEFRFALLFHKYFNRLPGLKVFFLLCLTAALFAIAFSWIVRRIAESRFAKWTAVAFLAAVVVAVIKKVTGNSFINEYSFSDFCVSVFKGAVPYLFIPALIGTIIRIRRKEWTNSESVLLVFWIGHAVLIELQILFFDNYLFLPPRYLIPAAVLEIPWAVYGVMTMWTILLKYVPASKIRTVKIMGALLLIAGILGLLYDYYRITINDYTRRKSISYRLGMAEIGRIIREDYKGPEHPDFKLDIKKYIINRNPPVAFVQHLPDKRLFIDISLIRSSVYYVRGRIVDRMAEAEYIVEHLSKHATEENMKRLRADWTELKIVDLGTGRYRIWKRKEKK